MAKTLIELERELRPVKPLSPEARKEGAAAFAQALLVGRIYGLASELRADPEVYRLLSECDPEHRQRVASFVRYFALDLASIPTEIDRLSTEAAASHPHSEIGSTSK